MRSTNKHSQALYQQLKNIDIYKRYPQMIPNVGENYKKKKLLLSCESYYFPTKPRAKGDTNHERYREYCKPSWWYSHDHTQVKDDEHTIPLDWIDIGKLKLCERKDKPRPWVALAEGIIASGSWEEFSGKNSDDEKSQEQALGFCAVMNYFPRPADQSKTFRMDLSS